jgi:hypothetical protein
MGWTLPVLDLFMREKLRSDTFWTDLANAKLKKYELIKHWSFTVLRTNERSVNQMECILGDSEVITAYMYT